jgi:hypothetical protein
VRGLIASGHHDDRQGGGGGPELGQQLQAVHVRHVDVHDGEVDAAFAGAPPPVEAVLRGDDPVPDPLERQRQGPSHRCRITSADSLLQNVILRLLLNP